MTDEQAKEHKVKKIKAEDYDEEGALKVGSDVSDALKDTDLSLSDKAPPEFKENRYDSKDMVERLSVLIAGPLKLAAYRVRDPKTLEWSRVQFHMTFHNTVLAVMEEASAELFAKFVTDFVAKDRTEEPEQDRIDVFINSVPFNIPYGDGSLTYDEIRNMAYPDSETPRYPSCTWSVKRLKKAPLPKLMDPDMNNPEVLENEYEESSGILYPGKSLMLEAGLNITIMDTSNA